jgi:hypothetical protein
MTFLSQLNYNFDTTKFGTAVDPNGTLTENLNKAHPILSTATASTYSIAVANNTANSTYFQNPVAAVCGSLASTIATIYNLIYNAYTEVSVDNGDDTYSTTDTYLYRTSQLTSDYNLIIQELTATDNNTHHTPLSYNTFISHTNRLSNLDQSNSAHRPDFTSGLSACQTVQKIVHQTESNLTDSTTIAGLGLGCFTSLFIGTDLTNHLTTLNNIYNTAHTLFATEPVSSQTTAMDNCYNSFIAEMGALITLVQTQRQADENFYYNANAIATSVSSVNTLVAIASTSTTSNPQQSNLIKTLIGTNNYNNLRPS